MSQSTPIPVAPSDDPLSNTNNNNNADDNDSYSYKPVILPEVQENHNEHQHQQEPSVQEKEAETIDNVKESNNSSKDGEKEEIWFQHQKRLLLLSSKEPSKKKSSKSSSGSSSSGFKSLPRTIRWKVHLGLLSLPPIEKKAPPPPSPSEPTSPLEKDNEESENKKAEDSKTTTATEENNVNETSEVKTTVAAEEETQIQKKKPGEELLEKINTLNKDRVLSQSEYFEGLVEYHYNSPYGTNTTTTEDGENNKNKNNNNNVELVPVDNNDDPLSATAGNSTSCGTDESNSSSNNHNSWSDFYSSRETLEIIDVDLKRLSKSHFELVPFVPDLYSKNDDNKEDDPSTTSTSTEEEEQKRLLVEKLKKQRVDMLTQILFVYARHNPGLGYRQGMHEVLSFIWLALELDFYLYNNDNDKGGSKHFHKPTAADAYVLFETIMYQLAPAFDVPWNALGLPEFSSLFTPPQKEEQDGGGIDQEQPEKQKNTPSLNQMMQTVMKIIEKLDSSKRLHDYLVNTLADVPPHMYIIKWLRLIFIREIQETSHTLLLWDKIFSTIYNNSNKKKRSRGVEEQLLHVLEQISVAMIFRVSTDFDWDDTTGTIHLLMNYPSIQDFKSFCHLIFQVMEMKPFELLVVKKSPTMVSSFMQNILHQTQDVLSNATPQNLMVSKPKTQLQPQARTNDQHTQPTVQTQQQQQQQHDNVYRPRSTAQVQAQQENPMQHTFSNISSQWNKAMFSIGESFEKKVQDTTKQPKNNTFSAPASTSSSVKNSGREKNSTFKVPTPMQQFKQLRQQQFQHERILGESIQILESYFESLTDEDDYDNGAEGKNIEVAVKAGVPPKYVKDALLNMKKVRQQMEMTMQLHAGKLLKTRNVNDVMKQDEKGEEEEQKKNQKERKSTGKKVPPQITLV